MAQYNGPGPAAASRRAGRRKLMLLRPRAAKPSVIGRVLTLVRRRSVNPDNNRSDGWKKPPDRNQSFFLSKLLFHVNFLTFCPVRWADFLVAESANFIGTCWAAAGAAAHPAAADGAAGGGALPK
jgi:hypothetical protein